MPFTPFHFGPGLLIKSCLPRPFWFTSFVLANVLIDCEVLYYMWRGAPPLHRYLHTYVAGVGLGLVSGGVMFATLTFVSAIAPFEWIRKHLRMRGSRRLFIESIAAGLIGGVSHVFLDSLLYHEMHPYWPLASGNDMAGALDSGLVHVFCALAGILGVVIWLMVRDSPSSPTN